MEHMWKSVCALFLLQSIATSNAKNPDLAKNNIGTLEYCNTDVFFEPRCDASEVIFLKSAQYGRMRTGRCITDELGYIGCSADALGFLDSQCSGRRSCQVVIPQLKQHITSTCPRGMEQYLEVEYDCVKVAYPPKGYCEPNGPTYIRNQRGYVSNLVAKETGCGSADSPWRIKAQPGQQFRIRLWNFNYASHDGSLGNCDHNVLIQETQQSDSHNMCVGETREGLMYTSNTNEVELRLVTNVDEVNQDGYIIVEYEAFGCTERGPPNNGWMQRTGDRLSLGCNATSDNVNQWEMKCNGTHWVGEEQECLPVSITTTPNILPEKTKTEAPTQRSKAIGIESTMSILVITGLAVLLCLCIVLSCMAVYIVRYRRRERSPSDHDTECGYNSHNRRHHNAPSNSMPRTEAEGDNSIETDDYWTWQNNQRGPLGNNQNANNRTLTGTIASRVSRPYRVPEESTLLVRKPQDEKQRFGTAKKAADYDKLDPNFIEGSSSNENTRRDCTA